MNGNVAVVFEATTLYNKIISPPATQKVYCLGQHKGSCLEEGNKRMNDRKCSLQMRDSPQEFLRTSGLMTAEQMVDFFDPSAITVNSQEQQIGRAHV